MKRLIVLQKPKGGTVEQLTEIDEEVVRTALGERGLSFDELAAVLEVDEDDRRKLSWRLQSLRRSKLITRKNGRWLNCERATRSKGGPRGTKNGRSTLTPAKVRKIRRMAEEGTSWTEIGESVGTSPENALMIAARRRWAWVD